MQRRDRKLTKVVSALGMAAVLTTMPVNVLNAAEVTNTEAGGTTNTGEGNDGAQTGGTAGAMESSEYMPGNDSDVLVSNVSISNVDAGKSATISFTLTGGSNAKKKYTVDSIESVTPNIDSASGFVKDNETSRVTAGTANTINCSYTFQTKDNVETGYYPVSFSVVYTRKNTDGTTVNNNEYVVTKEFSVKITGKKTVEETPGPEITAADTDVSLQMKNSPNGIYGGSCNISFNAVSKKYSILSVAPVVDENFPFKSSGDAYKIVSAGGTKNVSCNYHFDVKNNVATGYSPVNFEITYKKDNQVVTAKKVVNVELTGKKEKDKTELENKKSTPRVMVVGYTTDVKEIKPNSKFALRLQIKNNSPSTVKNIKFTLSTANGEFLPVSGASTAYVDSIGAKGTVTLEFIMKANAGLGAKSYPITIKSEYEDGNVNTFEATDNVSIPITVEDRLSLSDVYAPSLMVGDTGDISLSINNMGAGTLSNVTVKCVGDQLECEEAYIGNIGSGSTEYANVTLTGAKETLEEGEEKAKIIVSYENASGDSKTYEEETEVYVSEMMDEEAMMMDEEMMMEEPQKKAPVVPIVLGVGVVAAIVGVIVHKKKKKKRMLLEQELMEDELP